MPRILKLTSRAMSLLLVVLLIVAMLGTLPLSAASGEGTASLGSVSSCAYDPDTGLVNITGTVNHKVMTANKNASIGLYIVLPWESAEAVVSTDEPIATTSMTIRFTFSVSRRDLIDRLCQYAVAIIPADGLPELLAPPRFIDATCASESVVGFKGVGTSNTSAAVEAGAGCAVVDVMLDRLEGGGQSGYFLSVGGNNYYFDREYTNGLDKKVRSYYASGADVLLRLLIPAEGEKLDFAVDGGGDALYRGVTVGDTAALITFYAYVYFLAARYDSADYGQIAGIILGRGADEPDKYNYCAVTGSDYYDIYARSLTVVGIAADEASDNALTLIVPVGDTLAPDGICGFTSFISDVGDYISGRTSLSFTVMCEGTHNPYSIYDDHFLLPEETDPDADTPTEPVTEPLTEPVTGTDGSGNAETSAETTTAQVPAETQIATDTLAQDDTVSPETTASPETTVGNGGPDDGEGSGNTEGSGNGGEGDEPPPDTAATPVRNGLDGGFFCTDTLNVVTSTLGRIRSACPAVNDGYIWCWYPNAQTVAGALGVCYAYNYLQLAAAGADSFIVSFDNGEPDDDVFSHISHMFKYISTGSLPGETEYALSVFGVASWGALIDGWNVATGIYETLTEGQLSSSVYGVVGSYNMWDFTSEGGTQGWYAGLYCDSLQSASDDDGRSLKARIGSGIDSSAGSYADIGYICEYPEPLLYCDRLSIDVRCGDGDGSLYEVKVKIYGHELKIEDKAVVISGERTTLYLNTEEFPENTEINAVRVCVKRVTGSGAFDINLYSIAVNSYIYDDAALAVMINAAREDFRNPQPAGRLPLTATLAALSVITCAVVLTVALAYRYDKKHGKKPIRRPT